MSSLSERTGPGCRGARGGRKSDGDRPGVIHLRFHPALRGAPAEPYYAVVDAMRRAGFPKWTVGLPKVVLMWAGRRRRVVQPQSPTRAALVAPWRYLLFEEASPEMPALGQK